MNGRDFTVEVGAILIIVIVAYFVTFVIPGVPLWIIIISWLVAAIVWALDVASFFNTRK